MRLTESDLQEIVADSALKLFEWITKEPADIGSVMLHKAPKDVRKMIMSDGLKAQVGASYQGHWEGKALVPSVFLYSPDKEEYDTTYDDDVWAVDTSRLDKTRFQTDPDEYMYKTYGSVIYTDNIPPSCLKLVKKGTGESF